MFVETIDPVTMTIIPDTIMRTKIDKITWNNTYTTRITRKQISTKKKLRKILLRADDGV